MPTPSDTTPSAPPEPDRLAPQPRLLSGIVLAAIACFALLGIGSPLLGQSVFGATDEMVTMSPYSEVPEFAAERPTNNYLDDTWDSAMPNTILFADRLRAGEIAAWNPYTAGGVPLGSTPNYALASPLTVPFYVLPGWFAPGVMKLLEILVAVGGTYLFLRRLRLRPAPALLGGLVFASSAFMVVWTNWPQTRVAAFIPAVFWAAELIVQRHRARDAAVLALAVAAMLFGGFPAVTGYTLATAGVYFLVRVWCEHGRERRRAVGTLALAGGGLAGAVLLAAVQLVPWVVFMRSAYVVGRGQTPDDHLSIASLVTSVAPWALGSTNPYGDVYWYLKENLVESMSYVGAAALVLAVAGAAMARRGRALLPRGAWAVLVGGAIAWLVLIYGGRIPLTVAQKMPFLFSDNFVGRARCILGFLVAVLAAVGLELLLRRRTATDRPRRGALVWAALVWGGVALGGLLALRLARQSAFRADRRLDGGGSARLDHLTGELAVGVALVVLALACAAVLWWQSGRDGGGRPALRLVAAGLLPLLVAGQALTFVVPYWPRSDKSTFYPVTDTHRYLEAHLGHDRFASLYRALSRSVDSVHELRSATGHAFTEQRYGELIRSMGNASGWTSTNVSVAGGLTSIASPTLDRMAVKYGVAALDGPVPGEARAAPTANGVAALAPGTAVTRPVPGTGPVRALQLTPTESADWTPTDRIEAVVTDATGREVARTSRRLGKVTGGAPLFIPVAAEDVPPGTALTATITVRAAEPLPVQAVDGQATVGAVGSADDGLKLAYVGSAAVYERTRAVPRIRWAANPVVDPDGADRLRLLRSGTLTADQVVLEQPATAGGGTAQLEVTRDGTDDTEVTVTARGTGYLVLADPIQDGWTATIDGAPATLLRADHAFVAVAVPDGQHTVRFAYASPHGNAGGWLTLGTGLLIVAVFALGVLRDRRRNLRQLGSAAS
ncbi:YfhO family protein [Phytohabitans rumicis]|uniref:YfhO family protein n=1 Tax=Phytohabitans rumicis TaxID=1076125 RepID=UPI001563247A|nr:YfhO family protein [Phytohabitans rumicis]